MSKSKNETKTYAVKKDHCSLCGGHRSQKGPMVETDGPTICYGCARSCQDRIEASPKAMEMLARMEGRTLQMPIQIPAPQAIYDHLSQYVIGQDLAKRVLAVAAINHYLGIQLRGTEEDDGIELEKSNVLFVGPTGVGKTALIKRLADIMAVPFAIGDATTLTEAGYVGEDVESLLLKLIRAADNNIQLAERGIIYIDEIDKIGKTGQNVSITRDVTGEGVQQCLLKLMEGTIANVPPQGGRKHPEQQYLQMDTTNILFICGGTFTGIEKIVAKRIGEGSNKIGYAQKPRQDEEVTQNELRAKVTPDDLVEFGLIPEFIGRLPEIASLDALTVADLRRIIVEPANSEVRQAKKRFKAMKIDLQFTDAALDEIAKQAHERKTGARGLRSVLANLLREPMFTAPDHAGEAVTITKEMVIGNRPVSVAEAA